MFCKKSQKPGNIPPTEYAFHLHVLKAFLLVRQKQEMAKAYFAYDINATFINIATPFFPSLPFFHAMTRAEKTATFHKKKLDISMGSVGFFSYKHRIIS